MAISSCQYFLLKTSISQFQQKSTDAAVTLDSVKAAINAWRETKKSASEKMPTILWNQILALLETTPFQALKNWTTLSADCIVSW